MKKKLTPMTRTEQAIGWPYLVIQLFFLPVLVVFINYWFDLKLSEAMLNVILFTLDFLLILTIFHRFLFNELKAAKNIGKVLLVAVIGFALYFSINTVVSILVMILKPDHINANNEAIGQLASQEYTLMLIGTVLLVPITEEALFRGLLFGTLYRKSAVLGYVLSTLIFAAVHVVGYIGTQDAVSLLISLIEYLPAGLVLGWAYARSGTIWTPILIHAVVNFIGMSALR